VYIFLRKILLFSLALTLSVLLVVFQAVRIGKSSGELLKLDEIIEIQQRDDVLHGINTYYIDPFLKYKTANILDPDILALGTSRIISMSQKHFIDSIVFYNAGPVTQNFPAYYDFIESLDVIPRFIILNLDPWQFNENYFSTDWAKLRGERYDYKNGYEYDKVNIIRSIFRMLINGEFKIEQKFDYPKNMGFLAVMYGEGFGKDGAHYRKRVIDSDDYKNGVAYNFVIDNNYIDRGKDIFAYGDGDLYDESIKQVDKILRLCKDNNIRVVAFMPPFAPTIYKLLMENGHYEYMAKIYPTLLPIFEQYGFELYDFTDASGFTDDSMSYDGYHPDDRAAYNMLLSMKEQGSIIGEYVADRK
jgi:hypothetical protein